VPSFERWEIPRLYGATRRAQDQSEEDQVVGERGS